MNDTVFQAPLYLGLATAIGSFTAAAAALGLLKTTSRAGRFAAVVVLLAAVLGIVAAFLIIARRQPTAAATVTIALALVVTGSSLAWQALTEIFTDEPLKPVATTDEAPHPRAIVAGRTLPPHRRRDFAASGLIIVGSVGALVVAIAPGILDSVVRPGRVEIDNRVTNGPVALREDATPVSLTSRPAAFCGRRGCNLDGTERSSGDAYEDVVCQTSGERITNGNDSSASDDGNPRRFESTRHYGIQLKKEVFGFVSEVWVREQDRGGLGLRQC